MNMRKTYKFINEVDEFGSYRAQISRGIFYKIRHMVWISIATRSNIEKSLQEEYEKNT